MRIDVAYVLAFVVARKMRRELIRRFLERTVASLCVETALLNDAAATAARALESFAVAMGDLESAERAEFESIVGDFEN